MGNAAIDTNVGPMADVSNNRSTITGRLLKNVRLFPTKRMAYSPAGGGEGVVTSRGSDEVHETVALNATASTAVRRMAVRRSMHPCTMLAHHRFCL